MVQEKDQLAISTDQESVIIDKKTESFIKCGRRWVTAIITTNLTALTTYLIYIEIKFNPAGRAQVA